MSLARGIQGKDTSRYIPNSKSSVKVTATTPAALADQFGSNGMQVRPSLFGVPSFGGMVTGKVVYPKGNYNGCTAYSNNAWPKGIAVIVLADRGG